MDYIYFSTCYSFWCNENNVLDSIRFLCSLSYSVNNLTNPYFVTGAGRAVPSLFTVYVSCFSVICFQFTVRFEPPLTLTVLLFNKFLLWNSIFVNILCIFRFKSYYINIDDYGNFKYSYMAMSEFWWVQLFKNII